MAIFLNYGKILKKCCVYGNIYVGNISCGGVRRKGKYFVAKGAEIMKRITYHEFTFTNDYVFAEVMKNEELCRQLLQRILPDRKIRELRLCDEPGRGEKGEATSETQKDVSFNARSKGVRLDVLFRDDDAWYNIELQCSRRYNIPLRSRYYGGLIDLDQLSKGDDYVRLKNTYIIFICTFDIFGLGKPVYFFENYDIKNRLKFNDRSYRIIVNTKSMECEMTNELKALFDYINDNVVEDEDDFIRRIDDEVLKLNSKNNDWRREVMRLDEEFALRERLAREETREEMYASLIPKLLKKGMTAEEVAELMDIDEEELEKYS